MAQRTERTDHAFDTLHSAGWSIGETGGTDGWYVYGTRGEQVIDAYGRNSIEAWQTALDQANAIPDVVVAK